MAAPTETHFYDGRLKETIEPFREDLNRINRLSPGEKKRGFDVLGSFVSLPSRRFFHAIAATGQGGQNWDSTNDLHADDLLYLCYELFEKKERDPDFVEALNTQLLEMASGFCPQGRTHRLFQVVWAYS